MDSFFSQKPLSLLIPAWLIRREEANVQRRDGAYRISFEHSVVLHRHVVQNLLQQSRRFVVLISECWMLPSIDWRDDLYVLTPTVHGITSMRIQTLQSFLDTLESTSKVHNHRGKPAETTEMVSRSVGNLLSLRRRRALSANTMWELLSVSSLPV